MPTVKKKSNDGITWCSRALFVSPCFYGLCTSEEAFEIHLAEAGAKSTDKWVSESAHATTHFLKDKNDSTRIVVCVPPEALELDTAVLVGLLTHEATHVFQHICEYIGEDSPSDEFEAYSIETITRELTAALMETLEHNNKKNSSKRKRNASNAKRK